MSQSRTMSVVETGVSTAIGMAVAYLAQITVFPMFDVELPPSQHMALVAMFTVISTIRSFAVRRVFNTLR